MLKVKIDHLAIKIGHKIRWVVIMDTLEKKGYYSDVHQDDLYHLEANYKYYKDCKTLLKFEE